MKPRHPYHPEERSISGAHHGRAGILLRDGQVGDGGEDRQEEERAGDDRAQSQSAAVLGLREEIAGITPLRQTPTSVRSPCPRDGRRAAIIGQVLARVGLPLLPGRDRRRGRRRPGSLPARCAWRSPDRHTLRRDTPATRCPARSLSWCPRCVLMPPHARRPRPRYPGPVARSVTTVHESVNARPRVLVPRRGPRPAPLGALAPCSPDHGPGLPVQPLARRRIIGPTLPSPRRRTSSVPRGTRSRGVQPPDSTPPQAVGQSN